jgi:protein-S-isoprenylcysteine O-methyltransferase Ste14
MSAQTPTWKLARRAIFRALTFMLPFAFAGRLDWWRGCLFVGSLLLIAGVSFAVLRRKNPELLRRRLEWQPGVKRFESVVLAATIVGFLSLYAVAGLDARYGWSQLSAAWTWLGVALELLGFVPIYVAIAENPFLERQVRVQTELGHHVITTRPYGVVRHPN